MNDAVALAIDRAVKSFGERNDGLFTAAGFSEAIMKIAGLQGAIDGALVRVIMTGRRDVELVGSGHYRRVST